MQVLCKPKILPLKSVTLEKLEEMEQRMAEAAKKAPSTAASNAF
jgi:maleate cis-trans isomerase